MSDLKICTKCSIAKPLSDYYKKKGQSSGFNPSCKACCIARMKANYQANPLPTKIRAKEWREQNLARAKGNATRRYKEKSDLVKDQAKTWAAANPERRKQILLQSAEKHRDKKNAAQRIANKEFRRLFPEDAREEDRMRQAIRRTRERDNGINITRGWWQAIFAIFEGGTCAYCHTTGHKLAMDHWMPVSLGGRTEPGNLIPCCKPCNSRKSNKHPDEWMKICGLDDVRGEGVFTVPQFLECSRTAFLEDAA